MNRHVILRWTIRPPGREPPKSDEDRLWERIAEQLMEKKMIKDQHKNNNQETQGD